MLDPTTIELADRRRCAAMIAEDLSVLDELLDGSLLWIHSSARVDDKTSFLAGFGSTGPKYLEIERSDLVVRCFGEAAVVNGVQTMRCLIQGEERHIVNRYVNVWTEVGGLAKMVAWQSTAVPQR
jgi:hypothetical protein